ncbi:MAG: hypothetical protein L7U87_00110 [Chlamydiales bacterium]|nr:hypothetical protein [Chlamydiales bacterium]
MDKEKISALLELLKNIITLQGKDKLIKEFQDIMWEEDSNDLISDMLFELAYDLDYYESDPVEREKEPSFYDESELVKRVKAAVVKIEKLI